MIRVAVVSPNPSLVIALSVADAALEVSSPLTVADVTDDADVVVVDVHGPSPDLAPLGTVPLIVLSADEPGDTGGAIHLRRPCSVEDLTRSIHAAVADADPQETAPAAPREAATDAASDADLLWFDEPLHGISLPVPSELHALDPAQDESHAQDEWRTSDLTGDELHASDPGEAELHASERVEGGLQAVDPGEDERGPTSGTSDASVGPPPGPEDLNPAPADAAAQAETELDQRSITAAVRRRAAIASPPTPPAAIGTASTPASRRGWRRRRPTPPTPPAPPAPPSDGLSARMARTLLALGDVEGLVDEFPALLTIDAVADAVVSEIAHTLRADTCGLWRPDVDGWHVVAHRGLTVHERRMVVPHDQPLFHEVHQTGGGILIHPIDVVPTAVAGIGGAHTHGLVAAALSAGPGRFGIVVVGRDEPLTEHDLDVLLASTAEALPAVALADLLDRLRTRADRIRRTTSVADPADVVVDLTDTPVVSGS